MQLKWPITDTKGSLIRILQVLIVAVVYAASGWLSLWSAEGQTGWTTPWLPSAMGLGSVLILGRRAVLGVVLGALVLRSLDHSAISLLIISGLANFFESFTGTLLLNRFLAFPNDRFRPKRSPHLSLPSPLLLASARFSVL